MNQLELIKLTVCKFRLLQISHCRKKLRCNYYLCRLLIKLWRLLYVCCRRLQQEILKIAISTIVRRIVTCSKTQCLIPYLYNAILSTRVDCIRNDIHRNHNQIRRVTDVLQSVRSRHGILPHLVITVQNQYVSHGHFYELHQNYGLDFKWQQYIISRFN